MASLWVLLLVACQGVPTDDRARSVTAVEASSEPARMTEAQLRNAAWRLGEPIDEHARPRAVPADARATFARFVDAELARRRAL